MTLCDSIGMHACVFLSYLGPSSTSNSHSRGRGDVADEADEDIGVAR